MFKVGDAVIVKGERGYVANVGYSAYFVELETGGRIVYAEIGELEPAPAVASEPAAERPRLGDTLNEDSPMRAMHRLRERCQDYEETIEALKAERDALAAALEFYSDDCNYADEKMFLVAGGWKPVLVLRPNTESVALKALAAVGKTAEGGE